MDLFDPVTEADKAAEQVIRQAISKRFSDHGILGEEFGATNADAEYQWIIDPIDGTKAFISGLPSWDAIIMTTSPAFFDTHEFERYQRLEALCKLPRYGADCYAYCMLALEVLAL